ncbi:2-nitropropane dioxygenase [Macrolepiota fuliginosa MF-IS2]|uniref:2-nitropropane dioxygenase n=1 Tax=Macrolepiota fuliginosa MF-IS2 TaxID=1400762 RepID=A0A9P5XEL1_9AGAR|nr:2-nitropropane dioxygenase [Macrolepiota fuliginosa MF-IS2]
MRHASPFIGILAAQVTLGGGFGFVGAGYETAEQLGREMEIARQALVADRNSPLRIGVGFLCWRLEADELQGEKLLQTVLNNHVVAIWLAFGSNLPKWIQFVRDHDAANGGKTIIFVQLSSVEETLVAIHDWKVDVIVAQGIEAGGHGASYAPPLKSLIPSILSITPDDGPAIVGAGGLATGGHVAELLTLGAAGAVLGTRFLMTPESLYTESQQQALAAAESTASIRTMAFDQARGTLGWPSGVDGRGLRNATVDDYERGEDIGVLRSKFQEAVRDNDTNRTIVWAGAGVALMKDVKPAKEVTQELHQECLAHLKDSGAKILSV